MKSFALKCVAACGGLGRAGAGLSGFSLFAMMLVGVVDVVLPKLTGVAFAGAYELTETLMVACVFLPLAWTQERGAHIRMDFLRPGLSGLPRRAIDLLVHTIELAFYGTLAFQAWCCALRSLRSREYASGQIDFPIYPTKFLLAGGLSLMVLQLLACVLKDFRDAPLPGSSVQ